MILRVREKCLSTQFIFFFIANYLLKIMQIGYFLSESVDIQNRKKNKVITKLSAFDNILLICFLRMCFSQLYSQISKVSKYLKTHKYLWLQFIDPSIEYVMNLMHIQWMQAHFDDLGLRKYL